ncbi:hypothetical protein [Janthinobacterium tructae]|uniref:Uncharacterized protein n=1 Tax=Janthinobacterium tructae TaxID=2590869 RepID=A0A4Y6R8X8_9BURK|nr:hypothetical protein [Janthinobacterium tructae]QDG69388.1 hypothetical protein FJQ89_02390 [Janthinobacterium tructae]
MQYTSAIIRVNRLTLAAILVDPDQTYPTPGARLILQAQRYFPTYPIILLSPRVGGFSRSYAAFDIAPLIGQINADEIEWQAYRPPPAPELPF